MDSERPRRVDEIIRVCDAVVTNKNSPDGVLRQRIQTDYGDGAVRRNVVEVFLVIRSEPVGPAAGQPKRRAPQMIKLGANAV